MIRTKSLDSHKLKSADIIFQRGTYNSFFFKFSNKFYKDTIFKAIFKLYTKLFSKFRENKTLHKNQLIKPILKRFKINNEYIENLISKFSKIFNETINNENLNPNLKSNVKLLPMILINKKNLGGSLVIELCLSHYKMIFMNNSEEKSIKIFSYPQLNSELFNANDSQNFIIKHLGQCIIDFLKLFDTSSIKVLPIIIIKNDEQNQLKRSNSITEENPNSQKNLFQNVYDMVDDENTLNGLQDFLDQLTIKRKENEDNADKSFNIVHEVLFESEDSDSVDTKFEAVKQRNSTHLSKKLLVCAAIDLTMASFLANYFYDQKCELLVNLNTELKFSYYDSSIEKLVCVTFNKLLESGERKNSDENNSYEFTSLPNVYSILTAFDLEFDCSNDGKGKYFNNLIGILNQCELVRLILVDLMMYGVLFEKDYRLKGDEIKKSMSEVKDSSERRPIVIEKIIKKHNPNIKLYIKYCLHTKLYSDIENDTSCNLSKVKSVLNDLGLKQTSYFDRIVTKSICKSITERSAQILAGLITSVFKNLNSSNQRSTCIGLDGMIFKSRPIFNAYLEYYLNFYMKKEMKYYLKISRVDYSLGAAYAIVFVLDRKLREETLKTYRETINNLSCKNFIDDQVDLRKNIFSKFSSFFNSKK
jgi:hexokinase